MTIADDIKARMRRQLAGETVYACITEMCTELAKVKFLSPSTLQAEETTSVAMQLLSLANLMLEEAQSLPRADSDVGAESEAAE